MGGDGARGAGAAHGGLLLAGRVDGDADLVALAGLLHAARVLALVVDTSLAGGAVLVGLTLVLNRFNS